MKKIFKNLISALSAAAMLSSFAVPSVFAGGTALDAVNGATKDTIGEAVASVVTESGKFDYSVLPECDRTEINERMLAGVPYADDAVLFDAYQTALEYTTQVDKDNYDIDLIEDFSNLDDGWTQSSPAPYIGSSGVIDSSILRSLNISGNETSFMEVWGAPFGNGGNQYISRKLSSPYCIVSGYMYYSNIDNMPKVYYGIEGSNRNYYIGNGGTDGAYRYNDGSQWISNIAENDKAWHKVVFDSLTEPGKVKGYFDGRLLFTAEDTMKTLKVGCLDTINDGFYIFCLDNVSIAKSKPAEDLLDDFNANPVTDETLGKVFLAMDGDKALYDSLPACDRLDIADILELGRPYGDIPALAAAYQSALETVVSADTGSYSVLWTEDFSNYSTDEWTVTGSLRANAIGSLLLSDIGDQPRRSLNISGEECSAGFVGAALTEPKGSLNYIEREVDNPNSIVTAYFYDAQNDGNARYRIAVSDNVWVGRSDEGNHFNYNTENGIATSNVEVTSGWHKVVFDCLNDSKYMGVYLDGNLIAQSEEKITKVLLGNPWVDDCYDIVWMDNISVVTGKLEETVSVTNKGMEITNLPASGIVNVSIQNPSYQNDYIIAAYKKDGSLYWHKVLTKETLKTTSSVNLTSTQVRETDTLKILKWGDINKLDPKSDAIELTK